MNDTSYRMVYQMRLTTEPNKGWGLVFGTEENELDQDQSFVYTIPVQSDGDDWRRHNYRFPGLKGEKYIEFEARAQNEVLVVQAENVPITFAPLSSLPPVFLTSIPVSGSIHLPYLGKHDLVGAFKLFLPLYPVNTIEMEHLYKEKGVVLVGLTPVFGPEAFTNTLTDSR